MTPKAVPSPNLRQTTNRKTAQAKAKATNVLAMPTRATAPRSVKAPAGRATAALSATEAIALRAYALFEARGFEHGHDVTDWLQAEREALGQPKLARRRAATA